MNKKRTIFLLTCYVIIFLIIVWLNSWKEGELRFGLIYHHPVGDYTGISKIHWLGSPTQFAVVSPSVESDLQRIRNAGYKSVIFHVAIACLNPYYPYPSDFNYSFLKQNVKWISDMAAAMGLEVYVLYYPDWRCPPYSNSSEGYYYNEGSVNWNLMADFTSYLVACKSVRWAAPFCLSDNMTAVRNFFDHLTISPKVLIHADQPYLNAVLSSFPKEAPYEEILDSRNRPKLLEAYDEPYVSLVRNLDEHIITGQQRNGTLTQSEQIRRLQAKIASLGNQRNTIIWCYADYPDSSSPQDFGLVQSPNESLPSVEAWNEEAVQTYWAMLTLLLILAIIATWLSTKNSPQSI